VFERESEREIEREFGRELAGSVDSMGVSLGGSLGIKVLPSSSFRQFLFDMNDGFSSTFIFLFEIFEYLSFSFKFLKLQKIFSSQNKQMTWVCDVEVFG
jgi:hypothetical protein